MSESQDTREESFHGLAGEHRELLLDLRPGQHVPQLVQDLAAQEELYVSGFGQSQTGRSRSRRPSGALQEHHAIEHHRDAHP
jgi:hypothetical protein